MKNDMYHFHTFQRQSNGRIFVKSEEDANRVREIIRKMDEFEYEYMPDDLITSEPISTKILGKNNFYVIKLSYTHKFDNLDLNELQMRCFLENIPIAIWECGDSGESGKIDFIDVW